MREYHGFSCKLLRLSSQAPANLRLQGGNIFAIGSNLQMLIAGLATAILSIFGLSSLLKTGNESPGLLKSFFLFAYSCFIKPHQGDTKGNQQDALESFYKKQAGAYDATRKVLLRGREDMLSLVAAQLQSDTQNGTAGNSKKKVWVDVSLDC
jgi:betaine lipid synthase